MFVWMYHVDKGLRHVGQVGLDTWCWIHECKHWLSKEGLIYVECIGYKKVFTDETGVHRQALLQSSSFHDILHNHHLISITLQVMRQRI